MKAIADRYDPTSAYDLAGLRYVRAIAACGSMTAAAKRLKVSQPTLSVAVRELEARLGTSLFLRGPKGVVPTASGMAVARVAEEVFALLRQADDEIRGIESTPAGRFVVGCNHSFGAVFLPPLMRELPSRAPRIALALWEGTSAEVAEAVVERTVHFGVGAGFSIRAHDDLVNVPLFRDVMAVVRSTRRRSRATPLFYVPRIGLSERVVEALRARGELPDRVVPCGDLELVKSFVVHGAGIGVLPWRVATSDVPRGAIELVDPAWPFEVDVGTLCYRADLHRTRGAMLVRDELVARGRQLAAVAMPCGVSGIGASPVTRRRPGSARRG